MEKKSLTPKDLRQRKLFLALPILALPFLTLFFWAMGGGTTEAVAATTQEQRGFNSSLPNPNFKDDKVLDKLSYYDNAMQDSMKGKAKIAHSPDHLSGDMAFSGIDNAVQEQEPHKKTSVQKGLNTTAYRNPSEEKVYKRLEALKKAVNNPQYASSKDRVSGGTADSERVSNPDIQRLESMMQTMSQPTTEDPELQQLGSMLETIVDIQHPERVQERLRQQSKEERGRVFSVTATANPENVSVLENGLNNYSDVGSLSGGGFYSLDEGTELNSTANAITAVVHENQVLVNGSVVKFRLTADIMINGQLIPKDQFVFGAASLKGERLTIRINSLQYNASIFQVDLSVYDMDGMEGIYIPGAIARDVGKATADRSVQSMGVTTIDDSWSSQAAGAGIEAAKTLFSKKVKLIKVTVKAGYQVLLYDEKANKK
jgi:conjugative transposon TraM protein